MLKNFNKNRFLFEELVKRDFNKKYKRTILGVLWSILSPLLMLLVMYFIFGNFFAAETPHYIIYLFTGQVVLSFFLEATTGGMAALTMNNDIIKNVNVSKYLFVLSQNTKALINFIFNLLVLFAVVYLQDVPFSPLFLLLLYPIVCILVFNIGLGLILSALYVFFKDIAYLYSIFTQILTYASAIFYSIDRFPQHIQTLFYLNPLFVYIKYFRQIIIDHTIPQPSLYLLCALYALVVLVIGSWVYKKYNYLFLYYL